MSVGDDDVGIRYADVFVVVREGEPGPGPNDWEATVRTPDHQHFPPGTYELRGGTHDDVSLSGHAVLRFSNGRQHHFRGDGHLGGVEHVVA